MLGDLDDSSLTIDPIIAWKALNCGWGKARLEVFSPEMYTDWSDGTLSWDGECRCVANPAIREARRKYGHDVSGEDHKCHCGVNAWADQKVMDLSGYCSLTSRRSADLVARLELTGEVRRYERGWRSQRARIQTLWYRYDRRENELAWLRQWCHRRGAAFGGSCLALARQAHQLRTELGDEASELQLQTMPVTELMMPDQEADDLGHSAWMTAHQNADS